MKKGEQYSVLEYNPNQHSMKTPSFDNDPVVKQAHSDSNFKALQLLKETELTLQAAHNRIKVLQAQQSRNQVKAQQNLTLLQKLQQARQAEQTHLSHINSRQLQLQHHRQEQALRSQHLRTEQQAAIKHNLEKLKGQKKQQYLAVEENSQKMEQSISQSRLKELAFKEQLCELAGQQQEEARKKLIQYHQEKQVRLKEQKKSEVQGLKLREQISRGSIEALGKIEMELIAKQSQSKAAYMQSKKLLDDVLNSKGSKNGLEDKSWRRGKENKEESGRAV